MTEHSHSIHLISTVKGKIRQRKKNWNINSKICSRTALPMFGFACKIKSPSFYFLLLPSPSLLLLSFLISKPFHFQKKTQFYTPPFLSSFPLLYISYLPSSFFAAATSVAWDRYSLHTLDSCGQEKRYVLTRRWTGKKRKRKRQG